MSGGYLYDIRPEDAREALKIAERVRSMVEMMRPMIDEKPGRNLRWETAREIDRIASLIGEGFAAGRVLLALSQEFAVEWGSEMAGMPDEFSKRRAEAWEARLKEMGVSRPRKKRPVGKRIQWGEI